MSCQYFIYVLLFVFFFFFLLKKQTFPNMILDLSYINQESKALLRKLSYIFPQLYESFTRKYKFVTLKLLASSAEACNFIKKRLQHRCFPVNIQKFVRIPIMKNVCERLFLDLKSAKCEKKLLCNNLQYSNICFAREETLKAIYLHNF